MAAGQAELVYVKGPQDGQRASLMSAVVTVGRGQQADVQLTEEHVSRKHFQLTLTRDGWVFENLSTLKSRVNGKKYKTGKKIILDTGDVISVGSATELLFVATGDDTEAALIVYRKSGARKGKSQSASAAPAVVAAPDQQLESGDDQQHGDAEVPEGAEPPAAGEDEEDVELKPEEIAALEQKAKFKKYGVVFGVYIALLVVFVAVLVTVVPRSGPKRPDGRPVLLKKAQIDDYINAKLQRDRNAVEARKALGEAFLALDRTNEIDHLYKAVYWFKLSRAYGKVFNTEEERQFVRASKRLTKQVQEKYFNAYTFERDHRYMTADAIFRELLDMLPSMGRREERNELRQNIIAHVAYITRVSSTNRQR